MLIKIAYRQMEQNRRLNLLAGIQMVITFCLCIACVSVVLSETRYISGLWKYLNQKGVYVQTCGIIDNQNQKDVDNPVWLEGRMKSTHGIYCYAVRGSYIEEKTKSYLELEGRAYEEEIVKAYKPDMAEGNWLDKAPKQEGILNIVISQNALGLKTGDFILFQKCANEEKPIKAVIVGVVKDKEKIYGASCDSEDGLDYQAFYEKREMETEHRPIILMEKQDLEQCKKLTENSTLLSIQGSMILMYDSDITRQEAAENSRFLAENCEVDVVQKLSVVKENSLNCLWSKMSVVFPLFICALLLTIMTQLAVSVVIARRNLRNFMVYWLCGVPKRKIRRIALLQSILLTGISLGIAVFLVWIYGRGCMIFQTVIKLGSIHILVCLILGILQIIIFYGVQWKMIHNTTVIQGLNSTKDNEG